MTLSFHIFTFSIQYGCVGIGQNGCGVAMVDRLCIAMVLGQSSDKTILANGGVEAHLLMQQVYFFARLWSRFASALWDSWDFNFIIWKPCLMQCCQLPTCQHEDCWQTGKISFDFSYLFEICLSRVELRRLAPWISSGCLADASYSRAGARIQSARKDFFSSKGRENIGQD